MRCLSLGLAVAVLATGCTRDNPGFGPGGSEGEGTDAGEDAGTSRSTSAGATSAEVTSASSVGTTGQDSGPDTTGQVSDCVDGVTPFSLLMPEMELGGACESHLGMQRIAGAIMICPPGCQAACQPHNGDLAYVPELEGVCYDVYVTYIDGNTVPPCDAETRVVALGDEVFRMEYNSSSAEAPFLGSAPPLPFVVVYGAPHEACCLDDPACCLAPDLPPGTHHLDAEEAGTPLGRFAHGATGPVMTSTGTFSFEAINAVLVPPDCRARFSWKAVSEP